MKDETVKNLDHDTVDRLLKKYIEKDFQENEIEEIRLGIEENIDYQIYADKKYNSIQMRQIRLGLKDHLNVNLYADPDYDYLQMEEIRLGLEDQLDVDVYLNKDVPYGIMRQLRLGLKDGINLKKYSALGYGILRELRYALLDKQDISSYIVQGYDPGQLQEIRQALKSNCDIDKYLSKQYMDTAIREIRLGLEENLNVDPYAKVQYDWHQMREIRLGLEKQLDISKYARVLCSWRQMHEIRLGLEEGLDVDSYCSLMYSSKDMQKKRKELLELRRIFELQPTDCKKTTTKAAAKTAIKPTNKYLQNKITVVVDDNKMKASIFIGDKIDKVTVDELKEELNKFDVIAGINERTLDNIAKNPQHDKLYIVAQGIYPQKGKDGFYELLIENRKTSENITVDYMNQFNFQKVKKGEKFACYHRATKGIEGHTVTGKKIKSVPGKNMPILKGRNFGLSPDGVSYLSLIDGAFQIEDYQVSIIPLLEFDEVTSTEGDIYFDGNIHIRGNVNSSVKIHASNDIVVDGYVENSYIECGGNLCIKKGSNGNGIGELSAGNAIMGKFFENVTLRCKKSIYANSYLNCSVYAGNSVRSYDNDGKIIGGNIYACQSVIVGSIGNKVNLPTYIRVGTNDELDLLAKKYNEDLKEIDHQIMMLNNIYQKYNKTYIPQVRNAMPMYLKLEDAIYTKNLDKKDTQEKIEKLEEERKILLKAFIRVFNTIYEGTVLTINQLTFNVSTSSKVIYRSSNNKINVTKL